MDERPTCRMCRSAPATLTAEHVPPKSTGNRGRMRVEHLAPDEGRFVVKYADDGVALRVLCERCNTKLGSTLGTEFAEFAKQVKRSGKFEAPGGGAFVSAMRIYPGRVIRQLLLSFLCSQPRDDEGRLDSVRAFIKSRSGDLPEGAPRVSLFFNMSPNYRVVPGCVIGGLGTGRRWVGSEISAPGLGVLFTMSDPEDAHWFIEKRPLDISDWASKRFGHRESIVLRLPRLNVQRPHPLGFGTAAEVEKWQTRKNIAWLVAGADDRSAPNAAAAVWRPARHTGQ